MLPTWEKTPTDISPKVFSKGNVQMVTKNISTLGIKGRVDQAIFLQVVANLNDKVRARIDKSQCL